MMSKVISAAGVAGSANEYSSKIGKEEKEVTESGGVYKYRSIDCLRFCVYLGGF